ncbi:MAG TPA: carboxypeptidase regulatory-like domain-containing protein [Vicinamibacterales bacterium]|nr:carboxypeptidase regulatory-like domain-containing protein [Vicinamibacterales bacterium]
MAASAVLFVPGMARAQTSGEIFGRITDSSGAVMPGVTVTLTGPALITPQTTVSLESGAYRFPSIPIGLYSVKFEIPGFRSLIRENVRVETGFNAEINASLAVSTVEETVTVSAAGPVVDTRSTTTGQVFTREMLERIPSARDPWVMMEQTPGIIMSGQNVGGNQSGQQNTFIAHGTGNNEVWNLDGGNVTDQPSSSSSMYYDFDSFEEIQIQTGGSDASVQSSGVSINLVTRSGGNTFRGTSRLFAVDDNFQDSNISPELRAQGAGSGNPIRNIRDYGGEFGGPIKRNRAWFWGAVGHQDIRVGVIGFVRPGGDPNNADDLVEDLTTVVAYNAKLQYQWTRGHKSTFLYNFNEKSRNARGAGPFNPPETAFRQIAPQNLFKGSHQWIGSDRFSIEAQAMTMPDGGFTLALQDPSLLDVQASFDIATQMNGRSARQQENIRPQKEVRADGNYFVTRFLGGDHAVKFGAGWRDISFGFKGTRGGGAIARFNNGVPVEANLYRDSNTDTGQWAAFGYVQNAYSRGRLNINAGLRYDFNDDEALPSSIEANRIIPDLLPGVNFAGADSGVAFHDFAPRLGVTYDLTGDNKNIFKASYAMYWGTGITTAASVNPVSEVLLRYPWNDANRDGFIQRNELDLTRLLTFTGNFDPNNRTGLATSSTRVDPNLHNDRTDEFTIGFERELAGNFGVGALYIYRNYPHYQNFTRTDNVLAADYVPVTFTANCGNSTCAEPSYTVTYFELPFNLPGTGVTTNADRTRRYHGLELTARKRFSDRWMMNGSVNVQSTTLHYGGPNVSYQDPTDIAQLDGAQTGTANARWFGKVSGLYVLPWQEIGLSGFFNARQGYPYNRVIQSPTRRGNLGRANVDIDRWGDVRLENHYQLDLRLDKQIPIGRTRWTTAIDLFNVFNAATVLDRQEIQNSPTANFVEEVLGPRVARFSVRVQF